MAHSLTQLHRGTKKSPQFLFAVPKPTGRKTVSGLNRYEPDWFIVEAAGIQHPGETLAEHRERTAKRWRAVRQAAWVLIGVALCAGLWASFQ